MAEVREGDAEMGAAFEDEEMMANGKSREGMKATQAIEAAGGRNKYTQEVVHEKQVKIRRRRLTFWSWDDVSAR